MRPSRMKSSDGDDELGAGCGLEQPRRCWTVGLEKEGSGTELELQNPSSVSS